MEFKLNHDKRTALSIGGNNNNIMTNGKKLSFSIDSLLNGSSVGIPPTSHSVSKLLATTVSSSDRDEESRSKYNQLNSFPRFCPNSRDVIREKNSSVTPSPPTTASCLQSSFYPWLLAQRQAVAAAAFHPFSGMHFSYHGSNEERYHLCLCIP